MTKPAILIRAWQADDGSIYNSEDEATEKNRLLEFNQLYADNALYTEPGEIMDEVRVFTWLDSFPNLTWTITQPKEDAQCAEEQ